MGQAQTPTNLRELVRAGDSVNLSDLAQLAQSVKQAAISLSADAVMRQAERVEAMARNGEADALLQTEQLAANLQAMVDEVSQRLGYYEADV